jgi:hypothetical protein
MLLKILINVHNGVFSASNLGIPFETIVDVILGIHSII